MATPAEDLLTLTEHTPVVPAETSSLWGVVDSITTGLVRWRPVGMSLSEEPFEARQRYAGLPALSVGDRIDCVQYGRGGWIIRGKIEAVV